MTSRARPIDPDRVRSHHDHASQSGCVTNHCHRSVQQSHDQLDISPKVADFVLGSEAWEAANSKTRIEFRIAEEMVPRGLGDPFETDAPFYEDPYFVSHQINFGWFGVHYLYAPQQRPDLPWPRWETESVSLWGKGFDSRPGQLFPEL